MDLHRASGPVLDGADEGDGGEHGVPLQVQLRRQAEGGERVRGEGEELRGHSDELRGGDGGRGGAGGGGG